jgi:hypothetical protein
LESRGVFIEFLSDVDNTKEEVREEELDVDPVLTVHSEQIQTA